MQSAELTEWVIDVKDEQFEEDVLVRSNDVPVVVDFWAEWCKYCHVLSPHLVGLAKENRGKFILVKVNVDENPEWAGQMQISGLPAVRVIRNQQIVDGFDGALEGEAVKDFIARILPSEADNLIEQGKVLESTNPTEAETLYRSLLQTHPDHNGAKVGLARVLVQTHRDGDAKPILADLGAIDEIGKEAERLRRIIELRESAGGASEADLQKKIAADPENARLRYDLGAFLATSERYPEALESLIGAAELDKKLAGSEVRELMVKIFEIVGMRSELSETYRDRLRSLLY